MKGRGLRLQIGMPSELYMNAKPRFCFMLRTVAVEMRLADGCRAGLLDQGDGRGVDRDVTAGSPSRSRYRPVPELARR